MAELNLGPLNTNLSSGREKDLNPDLRITNPDGLKTKEKCFQLKNFREKNRLYLTIGIFLILSSQCEVNPTVDKSLT